MLWAIRPPELCPLVSTVGPRLIRVTALPLAASEPLLLTMPMRRSPAMSLLRPPPPPIDWAKAAGASVPLVVIAAVLVRSTLPPLARPLERTLPITTVPASLPTTPPPPPMLWATSPAAPVPRLVRVELLVTLTAPPEVLPPAAVLPSKASVAAPTLAVIQPPPPPMDCTRIGRAYVPVVRMPWPLLVTSTFPPLASSALVLPSCRSKLRVSVPRRRVMPPPPPMLCTTNALDDEPVLTSLPLLVTETSLPWPRLRPSLPSTMAVLKVGLLAIVVKPPPPPML